MRRYYCPFCCSRYQFHKTRIDGVMICGQCGETLREKPIINIKMFLSLVATTSFLTPLLIMIILVIKDLTNEKLQNNSEKIVLVTFKKSWNM